MASYSESFKISAVHELGVLRSEGILKVGNIEIKSVRQLCEFLDISSQTLYAWEKKFLGLKSEKNDVFDEKSDSNPITETRMRCEKESYCKAYQSDNDEGYGNCNMLGDCNDFVEVDDYGEVMFEVDGIDSQESESEYFMKPSEIDNLIGNKNKDDFFVPVQDKKNIVKEKVIFNQRYYGWFAGMLGIKYYSNMLVPQLKLAIGNELIKQSGLIDMNKASKNLKKNGDNL